MFKRPKPTIRFVAQPYFYGIPCAPHWVCESSGQYGIGYSPKDAYMDWKENKPGVIIRSVDRFIDRFGFGGFVFFVLVCTCLFGFVIPAILVSLSK
jgi:hypothetical protein